MFDDFFTRAAFAGVGVALAAAPLGCFIIWRRMAYFGDATAHAAILGVALALAFNIAVPVGILASALAMGLAVSALSQQGMSFDSALGVLSHGALAIGLVATALVTNARVDLMAYLFGDILAVNKQDLVVIWFGAAAIISLVLWRWSALLTVTLNPDLARASGIDPRREELVLILALALTVAVAIKVVGALLISALLIIPAATARNLASTPERMAAVAAVIGVASALTGLQTAFMLDTPTGPTIVCVAALFFTVSGVISRLLQASQN